MTGLRAIGGAGLLTALIACGGDSASDGAIEPAARAIFGGVTCSDIGPACGLTVALEGRNLPVGTYSIQVTTSRGVTSCNYQIEPTRLQTAAEAEAQDAFLSTCADQGTCPPPPCTGPDTLYLHADSITIPDESSSIDIRIENVETGARSSKSFSPEYTNHPARTAQCHLCRVAPDDSMPAPE